jgi:heat shock protein HslJ
MMELQQLAQLRDQGILTPEEFEAKKKQLLGLEVRATLALLAAVLLSAAVGGCGGDDEGADSASDASSLEGAPWVLASGVDVDGWEDVPPTIAFEEGAASGSTGCNQWTGSYTIDGDSLELGQLA